MQINRENATYFVLQQALRIYCVYNVFEVVLTNINIDRYVIKSY
jgi:hypothetical protein